MASAPKISVVKLDKVTQFAPLVALGFYVRATDLLSPIYNRVHFPKGMHTEEPVAAMIDLWISMLAGCRSVSQINTKIRPDLPLAAAWGRPQFKEQSTIAQALADGIAHLEGVTFCLNRLLDPTPTISALDLTDHPELKTVGTQTVAVDRYNQLLGGAA